MLLNSNILRDVRSGVETIIWGQRAQGQTHHRVTPCIQAQARKLEGFWAARLDLIPLKS